MLTITSFIRTIQLKSTPTHVATGGALQVSGLVVAPAALLLMAWALCMYRKRTAQILRRETVRYDDQRGPVVLTLVLLAVLGVAYGLALHSVLL